MLLMNGLVGDFNFAARLKGQSAIVSTLFYLGAPPRNPKSTHRPGGVLHALVC